MPCDSRASIVLLPRYLLVGGLLLLTGGCAGLAPAPSDKERPPTELLGDPLYAPIDTQAPSEASERGRLYDHLLIAELAAARGQHEMAAEAFLAAARLQNAPGLARRGIREALAAGRNDLALELARLWQETGEPGAEQHALLMRLATEAGDEAAAADHLRRYIASQPDPGAAFRDIARAQSDLDEHQSLAVRLLEEAIETHADSEQSRAEGYYALALLAYSFDQFGRAEAATTRALALTGAGPLRDRMLLLRAGALIKDGRADAASRDIEEEIGDAADPHSVRRSLAELLRQAGELEAARAQIEALLAVDPGDLDARLSLGLLAADAGDHQAARSALRTVWEGADGERGEAALQLGRLAQRSGERAEARRWFDRAAEQGESLRAGLELSRMDAAEGDVEGARERLQQLRADNPGMAQRMLRAEGEILYRARQYEAAVELLESGLATYPEDVDMRYAYALALEQSGELARAEEQLRQIMREYPDNASAYNALGYMLTINDQRLAEAEQLIARALELQPGDPAILDSMGWVLFKRGQPEEALPYLQKAFERYPDPEVGAHLGEVLWVLDRRDEAREIWEQSREIDPDHPVLRETLERLADE